MVEIKHRHCRVKHNPPESYGDCIAACVRMLVDDDAVPHTFEHESNSEKSWNELRKYLKTKGLDIACFALVEHPKDHMKMNNPGIPYMLMGANSQSNHAVVCIDDKVVGDPAWYSDPITKPMDKGYYVIGVITCLP